MSPREGPLRMSGDASSRLVCAQDGCAVSETRRCMEGLEDPSQCPHSSPAPQVEEPTISVDPDHSAIIPDPLQRPPSVGTAALRYLPQAQPAATQASTSGPVPPAS